MLRPPPLVLCWLFVAPVLAGMCAQPGGPDAPALASLLGDSKSIASAGVPGPLAVFGENAFVLVAGKDAAALLPVAAGARWEKGRVVALGHGGMIGGDALAHAGTRAFLVSSTKWLAGTGRRVGVLNNERIAGLLAQSGFATTPLRGDWQGSLSDFDAVVIDSHSIGPEQRAPLAEYIKRGGGLLTAGLGWGWLQLHPGMTIHDHPGNLLLRDAGLAWCDGTLSPVGGEFKVGPVGDSMHAAYALAALEAATRDHTELDAQSSQTLIAALRVIPRTHPLHARAAAVLAANLDKVALDKKHPLRAGSGIARTLLALQIELERTTPADEVRAHPAAADFPGSVPADAPRVRREIEVDLSIPGWHGTGLYAAPGEVITVEATDAAGCGVRIGCHTDTLWHLEQWPRVPDIARRWPLEAGETRVASAFGGPVYVEVPPKRKGSARFAISNAVEAPRFVAGSTTPEQWRRSRTAPAPWGEVESRKVIITVPSSALRTLENPEELMAFWDRISDAHATLATIPLVPERPHRFVPDVEISAGYMHSGYPIMTHLDAAEQMVSLDRLRAGAWGLLHELGHNHQQGDWTFDGTGEVTCNLFALHAIDTVCAPKPGDRGHPAVNTPPSLRKHLDAGAPFEQWKRDPFLALHMYVQLQHAFGWEPFQRVFAEYRALSGEQRPRTDAEKRDQWLVRFSRACGRNLGPFYQAWGVPTSDSARASIKDLPEWMPEDWPDESTPHTDLARP